MGRPAAADSGDAALNRHLILKLLAINLAVIVFVMIVVWVSVDMLAAGYFATLMEKYNISPEPAHNMFVHAVHRYLIWASLAALILAVALSFVMMRKVLAPLTRMTSTTRDIAAGNFSVRVPVDSADEVGQLARAFNCMAESLEKIENLRRTLMIDVAHELRTPLTNVRGYLEALNDGVLQPSRETISLLLDETLRLVMLTEDVLQLARADAARGKLTLEEVDFVKEVTAALDAFSGALAAKSVDARVHAPLRPVTAPADRRRISRVLRNLSDNAARYTPAGGRLEVRIEQRSDRVRVGYTNNGGELTQADLPYIFERFYRGEKSRSRQHGGAGIGLAIVKELVAAHGGEVGAQLTAGGVEIWFELPSGQNRSAAHLAPEGFDIARTG
jgi:two-component system, OmpR family, sensor histidine kinase BaeS